MMSLTSKEKKNIKDFSNLFCNGQDTALTKCNVKGSIPSWLSGQLLRTGPGEFDVGKETFRHWFDGHGIMHRFDIADGEVHYTSKFLQSESYKTNKKHNRIVVGGYGTPSIPDPCKSIFARFFSKFFSEAPPFDNCNVNVANLGNTFYTLTDASSANRIDPQSLDIIKFHNSDAFAGLPIVTAHPHYDRNGDYYNVGLQFGRHAYYTIGKVPATSMPNDDPLPEYAVVAKIPVDETWKPSYFHSFALSENYIAVHDQSVRYNVAKLLKSNFLWDAVMTAYEHDKTRESKFHVVDKRTHEVVPTKYAFKGKFTFHHINSYEDEDDDHNKFLIIDLLCSDGATFFWYWIDNLRYDGPEEREKVPSMWPLRFALPLDVNKDSPRGVNIVTLSGCQATAVVRDDGSVYLTPENLFNEEICKNLDCHGFELPQINYQEHNGRKYKYFYCAGNDGRAWIPSRLVKVDVVTKQMLQWKEKGRHPSEPIFIQHPDTTTEDDGVILSTVLSENPDDSIFLLILDAKDFKEIARAEVETKLPFPLHGCFIHKAEC